MKFNMLVFTIAATAVMASASLSSSEEKGSQMDETMNAMMEKMTEYSTPGQNHQTLNVLTGQWESTVKYWMSPDSEPEESMGTSEAKWIMDGRFIQQIFKGESMGSPFEGMGIVGFDNLTKKYNTVWLDNMGTGIMKADGTFDAASKTLTEKGEFSCPLTGGNRNYRSVTTIIDNDHYTYESFMADENGKEFRAMLIVYTRKIG